MSFRHLNSGKYHIWKVSFRVWTQTFKHFLRQNTLSNNLLYILNITYHENIIEIRYCDPLKQGFILHTLGAK